MNMHVIELRLTHFHSPRIVERAALNVKASKTKLIMPDNSAGNPNRSAADKSNNPA
jgi:hypothetical protein